MGFFISWCSEKLLIISYFCPIITLSVCVFVQIRRQAIKELPRFATGENILRVADILTQLLQTGIRCFQLNT